MYTNYRNALESKLDRIRNLENSGYGIPRDTRRQTIARDIAGMVLLVLTCTAWTFLIYLIA